VSWRYGEFEPQGEVRDNSRMKILIICPITVATVLLMGAVLNKISSKQFNSYQKNVHAVSYAFLALIYASEYNHAAADFDPVFIISTIYGVLAFLALAIRKE